MNNKVNRGKKNLKYHINLLQRGHVNVKDIDIIVTFKNKFVERIGFARWHIDAYIYYVKEERFLYWVCTCNIIKSSGFNKVLLKVILASNLRLI